jgi:hypothetical protein
MHPFVVSKHQIIAAGVGYDGELHNAAVLVGY